MLRYRARQAFETLSLSACLAALIAACGGAGGASKSTGANGGASAGGADGSGGAGDSTASGGTTTVVVGDGGNVGTGGATSSALVINSDQTELDVNGEPATIQLTAEYGDGSHPNEVTWSVDDTRIGSINDDGVFRANGYVAGTVTVTAQVGDDIVTIQITVTVTIVDNPDKLTKDEMAALRDGGSGGTNSIGPDGAFRMLYPYDKTVFPRGLTAPVVQFDATAATGSYLKLSVGGFSYESFAAGTAVNQATIPQAVWHGAELSTGGSDDLVLAMTTVSAAGVTGPVSEKWHVAQGTLKGIVYYNTYQSQLVNTGAVMRVKPGTDAEVVVAGCTVCHSVSANGNVLAAGVGWANPDPIDSTSFDLSADGNATLRNSTTDGRTYTFGALTPNGEMILTTGIPFQSPRIRGLEEGTVMNRLVDTSTGIDITAPTMPAVVGVTPAFSPDGTFVAYSDRTASATGSVLGVASFDIAKDPPVFGDPNNFDASVGKVACWPSFTPDDGALVFGEADDYMTEFWDGGVLHSEVRLLDLNTEEVSTLNALNGYDENGDLYLPYGAAEEQGVDYEPNVLPVAVGGYYWVLFTSRRPYGNTIAPGGLVAGGDDMWGGEANPSVRKKIWLAAIDLDYSGKIDPSHPPLYLPGQELEAGNMRAFAALEPCRADGASCESAAECCGGFCRETSRDADGVPVLECVPPPKNSCSNVDETCETAGDCCSDSYLCINHRCALPAPVVK